MFFCAGPCPHVARAANAVLLVHLRVCPNPVAKADLPGVDSKALSPADSRRALPTENDRSRSKVKAARDLA
jgi:hypothetical protein